MLHAGPPPREASGEWRETSSCQRKRQWEKGVDHVHRRHRLQGRLSIVPETVGTEEATRGCLGRIGIKSH